MFHEYEKNSRSNRWFYEAKLSFDKAIEVAKRNQAKACVSTRHRSTAFKHYRFTVMRIGKQAEKLIC